MKNNYSVRRRRELVAVGDLDQKIQIQVRALQTQFDSSDAESFVTIATPWAKVSTVRGKQQFDGVNLSTSHTHLFYIRFRNNVSSENWILYKNQRYDIIDIINLQERDEFLKISGILTGTYNTLNEAAWG